MNNDIPRIYLTLRCNLLCPYCSNGQDAVGGEELDAKAWLKVIATLPTQGVCLTGGEPTIHPGFNEIVHRCGKHVTVYTNLEQPLKIKWLPKEVYVRASCHSETADAARRWVKRATALRDAGIRMCITVVYPPPAVLAVLREYDIAVDVPQVRPTPVAPPVRCTVERILIGPDGKRYHCVGKLVRGDPTGRVSLDNGNTVVCQTPHLCAACDGPVAKRFAIA
jgi:MoaA/NifB/PqqE/SkfB family radical SAM enzyme